MYIWSTVESVNNLFCGKPKLDKFSSQQVNYQQTIVNTISKDRGSLEHLNIGEKTPHHYVNGKNNS